MARWWQMRRRNSEKIASARVKVAQRWQVYECRCGSRRAAMLPLKLDPSRRKKWTPSSARKLLNASDPELVAEVCKYLDAVGQRRRPKEGSSPIKPPGRSI